MSHGAASTAKHRANMMKEKAKKYESPFVICIWFHYRY